MSVKNGNTNLTRNQARAIRELLQNRTVEDAAEAAGVSSRTIFRWLNDPVFRLALSLAESNAIDDAVRALITDLKGNHEVMRQVRDDENNPAGVRLRAAQILDNSLLRWRELRDVESRLAALEEAFYGQS